MNNKLLAALLSVPTLAACGGSAAPADADARAPQPPLEAISRISSALGNGTFVIHPGADEGMCLDVAGGENRDGAAVQLAHCNGGAAQAFVHAGAYFRIFGDKCLNVVDGRDEDGVRLQIWSCGNGDDNAKWTVSGRKLQWKNHNKCLDLTEGRLQDGTPMQLWGCADDNRNQQWQFAASGAPQGGGQASAQAPRNNGGSASSNIFGATPAGLDVAPYYWSYARWSQNWAISSMLDAKNRAGMNSATLAFGLSGGGCNFSSDLTDLADEARAYTQAGGRLILSFGGAAGTFIWDTCSDSQAMARAFEGQMAALNSSALDFDIEGSARSKTREIGVLLDALKILQNKQRDLYISFTLPADENGLPGDVLSIIKTARDRGLRISRVNLMTMDFGHAPAPGQTVGDQCLAASESTHKQLSGIYAGADSRAIYHLIGLTPMIGQSDDNNWFTTDDARAMASYAKSRGIGMLSFWGMQRDRADRGDYNNHSNTAQVNYEFTKTFNSAR
jgi:hypothetical protein